MGGGGGSRKQASHQLELHLKIVQSKPKENELILSWSKQHSSGGSRPSDKGGGGGGQSQRNSFGPSGLNLV